MPWQRRAVCQRLLLPFFQFNLKRSTLVSEPLTFGLEALALLCAAVTGCSTCGHVPGTPGSGLRGWRGRCGSVTVLPALPFTVRGHLPVSTGPQLRLRLFPHGEILYPRLPLAQS